MPGTELQFGAWHQLRFPAKFRADPAAVGLRGGVLLADARPAAAPAAGVAAAGSGATGLSPKLRAYLDSKKLPPDRLGWFARAIPEYRFIPATEADVDVLTDEDNLWVLFQPATKALFEFCRTNFGYAFDASFPDDVRRVVDMEAFRRDVAVLGNTFLARTLGRGVLGQKDDGDVEAEFRKAANEEFAKRIRDFQSGFTPEDIAIVSDALRRSGGAFSIEGLRYYRAGLDDRAEAFRAGVRSARLDVSRLEAIAGGAHRGDAFLLAIASGEHPDILDRLETAVRELRPRAGRLTRETVEFVGSFQGDARLAGVVGWLRANFGVDFDLAGLARLDRAIAFDAKGGGEDAVGALAGDPASGGRVKAFIAAHGLTFDPFRLKYFLWPPAAIARYESYRSRYEIQALSEKNLKFYWNYFTAPKKEEEADPCLRPEVVKVARAIMEADPEGDLNDVVGAVATVLAYEKRFPKSTGILGRLIDAGVAIEQWELRGGGAVVFALLKTIEERPTLLDDVEELLRGMPSLKGKMGIGDVADFVALPEDGRRDLTHPPMGRFFELLCERYDLEPEYQYAKLIALQEKGAPLREKIPWLQAPEAQAFYAANRDLFRRRGKEAEKNGVDVVVAILTLFLRSKGEPKILEEARRWHEVLGRPADHIFVLAYDAGETRFLHDPGLPVLADAAAALGLRDELMESFSYVERFLPHRKVLASPGFQAFFRETPAAFGFAAGGVYNLDEALDLYRDAGMRRFLSRPEVRAFVADLRGLGFEAGWGRLGQARRLFERVGTLDDLRRFEAAHGIKLTEAIGKVRGLAHSPAAMLMQGLEGSLDMKGFDFFEDYLAMAASGDFALLLSDDAKAAHARLRAVVGCELGLLDLQTFVAFLRSPRTREYLLGDAFAAFWKELKGRVPDLHFWMSDADVYVNLGQNSRATFEVLDGLKGAYGLSLKDDRQLSYVAELVANAPAFAALTGPGCRAVVRELAEKHEYRFDLSDLWAILFLADHREMIERLYRDDVEALSRRIVGRIPGNDIADRLELARFIDDPAGAERLSFVSSDEFPTTLQALSRYDARLSRSASVDEIGGVFEAHRTPELFRFLDGIGYRSWALLGGDPLMTHLPGLAAFSKHPDAVALVKKLESMGSPRARYRFHPSDGAALGKLLEGRTVAEVARLAAPLFRRAKGWFSANDILYAVGRGKGLVADRRRLEAAVASGFAGDVHRMDSNFDSYHTYNTPSAFSLVDLHKMAELKGWLGRPETRAAVGAIIDRDIAHYPASELGGAILIGETPEIFEGEPQVDFENGSYRMPPAVYGLLSRSIATYHLHATSRDDGLKAGPSGDRFFKGGDISFAQRHSADGVVFTSLGEGRFCAHFYDENKNVAFLGVYEVPVRSPAR